MSLRQTVAPTAEPIELQDAKDFARIDNLEDDDMVNDLLVAARDVAETITRRALVTQTWVLQLDGFPSSLYYREHWRRRISETPGAPWFDCSPYLNLQRNQIVLPLPPVQSVSSITYLDEAGNSQTLSPSNYIVDTASEPARIMPAFNLSWPSTRIQPGAVTITFVAGYGLAAAVPSAAKTFIKMKLRALYDGDSDPKSVQMMEAILWPLLWGSYS